MIWVILIASAVVIALLFAAAQPATIHSDPKPGYFVIVNKFTGSYALSGRQFKTEKIANKKLDRLIKSKWCMMDRRWFFVAEVAEKS